MRDGLTRKAVLAVGVVLAIAHPISPSAQTDMSKASTVGAFMEAITTENNPKADLYMAYMNGILDQTMNMGVQLKIWCFPSPIPSRERLLKEFPPDQRYADYSRDDFGKSDPEHAPGPFRHILLGGEVALSALLFFGGVFFVYLGFQRASDALEHVLDGQRRYWIGVSFWLLIGLGGSLGASGIVTYWLSVCASC